MEESRRGEDITKTEVLDITLSIVREGRPANIFHVFLVNQSLLDVSFRKWQHNGGKYHKGYSNVWLDAPKYIEKMFNAVDDCLFHMIVARKEFQKEVLE